MKEGRAFRNIGKKYIYQYIFPTVKSALLLLFYILVSHDTFFKMADNTVRDEGPINPNEEAKRLGANLATPEKAKIARETKKYKLIRRVKTAIKPTSSANK